MHRPHTLGERLVKRGRVRNIHDAGSVGLFRIERRHTEKVQLDVATPHDGIRIRTHLLVGTFEAEHSIEVDEFVNGPARQQRDRHFAAMPTPHLASPPAATLTRHAWRHQPIEGSLDGDRLLFVRAAS